MTKFSDWPWWLQIVVALPHGLLAFVMTWFWRPNSRKSWLWFGISALYLVVALLVMHFAFGI